MNDRINSNLIDANVKLQDENNMLKTDKELLKKRINKAIEMYENKGKIEYKKKRFMENKNTADLMYEILKGEVIYD